MRIALASLPVVWRFRAFVARCCCAAVTGAAASATGQVWSPTRLDPSATPGAGIQAWHVATVGDALHVVWTTRFSQIPGPYYQRSLDGGATWLPTGVTLGTTAMLASVAVDRHAVHVLGAVWSGVFEFEYTRSLDGGTTWLPMPQRLPLPAAVPANNPGAELFAAPGIVFVAWGESTAATNRALLLRSRDGGATWTQRPFPVPLTNNSRFECVHGILHLVWLDTTLPTPTIRTIRSTDDGDTWSLPTTLDAVPNWPTAALPQFSWLADGSSLYVFWQQLVGTLSFTRFRRSTDAGRTWQTQPLGGWPTPDQETWAIDGGVLFRAFTTPHLGGRETWITHSGDGAMTWSVPALVHSIRCQQPVSCAFHELIARHGRLWTTYQWSSTRLPQMLTTEFRTSDDLGATWRRDGSLEPRGVGTAHASAGGLHAVYRDDTNLWHARVAGQAKTGLSVPGTGGATPQVTATAFPNVGANVNLRIHNTRGGAPAVLALSVHTASQPFAGGMLLVQPDILWFAQLGGSPAAPGSGNATVTLPIPASWPWWLPVLAQALVLDAAAAGGVAMSARCELLF